MADQQKTRKRILKGVVVSNKADKTIAIAVKRRVTHPVYSKQYTTTKKYYAHDEKNDANIGDVVEIIESMPISKTKRWALHAIVEKSVGVVE